MKKYCGLLLLYYFRFFAKLQLRKNRQAIVVGVTGSAGKSSAVDAIALVLSTKGRVKRTAGSNSESGISLHILGLKARTYSVLDWLRLAVLAPLMLLVNWERYDYYVVEMGIDSPNSPKNMSFLLSIVRPDIAVVLNAGLAHSVFFDHLVKDRDPKRRAKKIIGEIAKEKMKLLHGLSAIGVAIYNQDQKELVQHARGIQARRLTYGKSTGSKLRFNPSTSSRGLRLSFAYQHHEGVLSLPDHLEEGYAYTFAAALAVAAALSVPLESVIEKLKEYRAPAGRMRTFRGIRGMTILDSSYNASPASMHSALQLLAKVDPRRHKVAIIGDMRELGQETKEAHKQLADWLVKYTDETILFGRETGKHTLPVLESRRFPVHHFTKMADLNAYTTTKLNDNSLILIKGSQNTILLERAVEALLANKQDVQQLCRRGKYWDQIRAVTA